MFNLAEHIQTAQPARARDIETITGEILKAKRTGGEAILTIGRGLLEAKALLSALAAVLLLGFLLRLALCLLCVNHSILTGALLENGRNFCSLFI